MRKHFHKILFVSTIAVMTIILMQTVTGIVKLKPLHGAVTETEKPKLTFKSYTDGSFQESVENYCRDHSGFREWLIRVYNQYVWSCFRETTNATVVRGKEDWLFEESYIRDHYESMMYKFTDDTTEMKRILETEALRLWKVQELLKEYDIHIFVHINPGKDVIYPEFLPKNRTYLRPDGLHAYHYYKKRFDELGVNYIDYVTVFQNIKNSVDYPLFPKTGTHWSNIASIYAFDSIVQYMEILSNQNLINLDIGEKNYDTTRPPDNDMELILNLASPIKTPKNLYAYVGIKPDSTATKPYFLAIGDSFFFNFFNNIPLWDIFQHYSYWYYNSTIYDESDHETTLEVDFDQELMRPDYIMLIYNTWTLYEFSSYFLPKALLHLCYDEATIDSVANRLVQALKTDPAFYAEVCEVAKNKQTSVEQVMYEDAIYIINTNPEEYFEELKGTQLPVSRNKDLMRIRKNSIFARSKSLKE